MRKIICPKCGVEMRCLKNGMTVNYKTDVAYSGDRYSCPECDNEVVLTAKERLPHGCTTTANEHDVEMRGDQ